MSRSTRLAAAGLVAAAVLAIAACGTSTSSGGVAGATGSPATSAAPPASASAPASMAPSEEASPSGTALDQVFLQFDPQNDSNITGGAILTDLGDNQTAVTIGVVAAGVTEPMPANVVPNDCASAEPAEPAPSAPASEAPAASGSPEPLDPTTILRLGDLAAGSSNTVLALTLEDLTGSPHAVVIYRSRADGSIVACADITS
jgi:hypothetical protein